MPELAEVETVVRTLEAQLNNITILDYHLYYPKIIEHGSLDQIKGKQILKYDRYGKYLIFDMGDYVWICHLRMEGKFYIVDASAEKNKHIHVCFDLNNGLQLRYHDTRKFGRMYIYEKQANIHDYPCFKNVGLDVFDDRLNAHYLYDHFKKKNYTLKQALLDQKIMAGVGNIYSDEICFALSLHPESKVNALSYDDCTLLLVATRDILSKAIRDGGTTIRSYTSSLGVDGRFQLSLKVHSKKGEKCFVCDNKILKIKVGGRGTYYCDKCQRLI